MQFRTEKRKYKRVPIECIVEYKKTTEDEAQKVRSVLKNLSGGGLLFEANELIPIGSFIEIDVFQKENEESSIITLSAKGRVVRVEEIIPEKKYEIGVSFVEIKRPKKY